MWSWTSRGSVGHDRAGDGGCVMCMIFAWILRVRQGGGTGDSVE
jgi:hypothetical protein